MDKPDNLSTQEAIALLEKIHAILWPDLNDPDATEWDADTLTRIACAFHAAGINPSGEEN